MPRMSHPEALRQWIMGQRSLAAQGMRGLQRDVQTPALKQPNLRGKGVHQRTGEKVRGEEMETANRVDRLSALGNSVVPVQAAVAFVSLARELELIK